jgi:tripartite-type tricarboxylate transporter receptor subunit TctC
MTSRSFLCLLAGLALAILFKNDGAPAQAPPYSGKQIRVVVGSGAGGGVDVYARVLAQHLADHLGGHPQIVIENMPGAIGLTALNWLATSAPRDGTAMVASSNVAIAAPLFGNKAARYDPRSMIAIGNIAGQQSVCATWNTSATKTLEDAKRRVTVMAADAVASRSAIIPELFNEEIGTQFKVVTGYSTTDVGVAIERGEVDGACLSWPTLKASHPDWIINHRLNVLIQTGDRPHPDLPDVPLLTSLVSDPQTKQMLRLLEFPDELGRPYLMPPDSPVESVKAMRAAFDEAMRDQAFLADARKALLDVDPMSGEDMTRVINEAYATPKDIVARALPFSGSPTQ